MLDHYVVYGHLYRRNASRVSKCLECARLRRKERYANDPKYREYVASYNSNYRKINANAQRLYKALQYKNNVERVAAKGRQRRLTKPESVRMGIKSWHARNPKKASSYAQKHRALKFNAPINDFTSDQWMRLLEQADNKCSYCLRVTDGLTQDHIIPLSKGGNHTLANIVPACRLCNLKKGVKKWQPLLQFEI